MDNSGSAFGLLEIENTGKLTHGGGLTKREFFAAMAMQGIWSSGQYDPVKGTTNFIPKDITAQKAVEVAEALLKALEEKP